jgi:adenosylcobinamide-GDP ribazoletransferase
LFLKELFKGFKSLLSLLTTIPVGRESIEYATKHFYLIPIIGLIEGSIVSLSLYLLYIVGLNITVISAMYPLIHLLITGGIHLDGYADYSDVLGSHRCCEEAVKILKDSRRGTFAIISITLNILISFISIHLLLQGYLHSIEEFLLRIILVYIISVEAMYITAFFGKIEPYNGLGKGFVLNAKLPINIARNTFLFLAIYLVLSIISYKNILTLITILVLSLFTSIVIAIDANKRLGFVNGDVMGFTFEIVKLITMVLITCM